MKGKINELTILHSDLKFNYIVYIKPLHQLPAVHLILSIHEVLKAGM